MATTRYLDLGGRFRLLQLLLGAARAAQALGYPQTARLLGRLVAVEPLVQVVCRGGLVQAVHGLPAEIYPPDEGYEVLDYEDLERDLDDGEIAEIYRRAGLRPPADAGEARSGLDDAFARLEWSDGGAALEIPPGKHRRASVRTPAQHRRCWVGDWGSEATFPIVLIGGERYVFLGFPPEGLPDLDETQKSS